MVRTWLITANFPYFYLHFQFKTTERRSNTLPTQSHRLWWLLLIIPPPTSQASSLPSWHTCHLPFFHYKAFPPFCLLLGLYQHANDGGRLPCRATSESIAFASLNCLVFIYSTKGFALKNDIHCLSQVLKGSVSLLCWEQTVFGSGG